MRSVGGNRPAHWEIRSGHVPELEGGCNVREEPLATKTTLLITTDHGRGATLKDWSAHGKDVPAAEDTWMAALGPAAPPLGLRKSMTVTTSQLAATIAAAVGQDYRGAMPKAAPPLPLR